MKPHTAQRRSSPTTLVRFARYLVVACGLLTMMPVVPVGMFVLCRTANTEENIPLSTEELAKGVSGICSRSIEIVRRSHHGRVIFCAAEKSAESTGSTRRSGNADPLDRLSLVADTFTLPMRC
jgi:hypothetical protein